MISFHSDYITYIYLGIQCDSGARDTVSASNVVVFVQQEDTIQQHLGRWQQGQFSGVSQHCGVCDLKILNTAIINVGSTCLCQNIACDRICIGGIWAPYNDLSAVAGCGHTVTKFISDV